ncbi:TFIIB-type zinc ribbon-containing protein [Caldisphaera sp.]|jgi:transcription initiation factor TFIIIB Brf1 subunit/transcription initiation factor TFIIB|uniref:TFIIB-type zinc ribbon-containing protein n=1 Tax=Caldisphaera sp. TaxID=2060322 RepID=UPI00397AC4FB
MDSLLRCPYCKSYRLAWSDETGYLVCQNCGAVIQALIDDNSQNFYEKNKIEVKKRKQEILYYNDDHSIALEEKINKAIKRGKIIKTDYHGKSIISSIIDEKLEKINNNKDFKISYQILNDFPILKSRTKRNRYAIALYALYRSYGYSKENSILLTSKELKISKTTLKNIIHKHKDLINKYEIEVKKKFFNKLQFKLNKLK